MERLRRNVTTTGSGRRCWPPPIRLSPTAEVLTWPQGSTHRSPARAAGAYVVLHGGDPVLYVERGGKGLQVLVDPLDKRIGPALAEVADTVHRGRIKRLALERVDGEPVVGSEWEGALIDSDSVQAPASSPHLVVPEGDTIHYAANRIRPVLEGHVLDEIRTPHRRFARDRWPERLGGQHVRSVDARGKHLMIRFENGLTIHSHLRIAVPGRCTHSARSGAGTRDTRGWCCGAATARSSNSTGPCSS